MSAFLAGGGEAGALMRAIDWSRTSLGPVDGWPASLKTIVGTILHSRHPMFLWWGPELIQFYNDAYIPSFGRGKHPAAMGQRGADCWQEIWPIIFPQIDDVMRRGTPSWNEDHLVPIIRNGRTEEVYWTYGYSPVFDDGGLIGGTLVVCTETTGRVIAERRVQTIRALAEANLLEADAASVMHRAADVLSAAARDVAFALFYLTSANADTPRVVRSVGLTDEASAAIDAHFRADMTAMAAQTGSAPLPPGISVGSREWPEPVRDVFITPILTHARVTGYVLFGLSPRLSFDVTYREHLRQIAEQMGQAQARIETFRVRALVEDERNHLLEQAPVATALLTGPNHVFRLANPLYLQIVGRTELVGLAYLDAFPELTGTPVPRILDQVYLNGERFVSDEMHVPLDREGNGVLQDCYFTFNLEPLRDATGGVYGMMAVAVDVTPQVVARKSLEKSQAEREKLLGELEAASRAKDEFLAMLGHELRNPLSPILTALQLMRLRDVKGADREREIIERQVQHVVGLVDDLLDVSRITRGLIELKRDREPLDEVIAKGIEQASPLIEQRRHRLHVDLPGDLYVDGDKARLAQVVSNLLTNAAKYTDPGGDIEVYAMRRGDDVWLHVRDTGIGIGPDTLPHVFDPFAQERQRSDRPQGGLGLGLAIVRSLVEAHGGSVALHSKGRGHGTEAVVRLPAATSRRRTVSGRGAARPTAQMPGAGVRVLLVDDNEDAAAMLSECLNMLGHKVEVAADAVSALELATRFVPDVALLDLGLPVIDGYELATRLRAQEGWADVRFAALTGYGQQHDRLRTEAAGFVAHLVKPMDPNDVDATVRRLVPRGEPLTGAV